MTLARLAALMCFLAAGSAPAAALDDKSLAPAWTSAGQAEKDAWVGTFKFEKADADRTGIATCLDKMTAWEALSTNKLSSVTSLCETTVEKEKM